MTQAPNARSASPEKEKAMRQTYDAPVKEGVSGLLTQFRERELLPRILYKQLGADAEITPQTVLDWRYEKRGYVISRVYHIKTKEIDVDYVLAVHSAEAESAGQARKWFINLRESWPKAMTLTPLGEGVKRLRRHSHDWLRQRIKSLSEGEGFADFQDLDKTEWDFLVIEAKTPDERLVLQKQYLEQVLQMLAGKRELQMGPFDVLAQADQFGKWEQKDGKIRTYPMIRFTLRKTIGKPAVYQYEAVTTLETKQPIDPTKFRDDSPAPEWTLIGLAVTAITYDKK